MKISALFMLAGALACPVAAQAAITMQPIECPFPADIAFKIVGAKGELDGVGSEYAWLRKNRPGWVRYRQRTMNSNGTVFDLLDIRKRNEKQTVCFDISGYFGKY